ncbi:MAG: hypothetical protein KME42_13010 [Tildeniella nuda ZEHNDER 1965/U140]|jgi:hypothetical protein|nr:hypothetical protein [Tildeniella nuda ZEHNDER 1965/U140]
MAKFSSEVGDLNPLYVSSKPETIGVLFLPYDQVFMETFTDEFVVALPTILARLYT